MTMTGQVVEVKAKEYRSYDQSHLAALQPAGQALSDDDKINLINWFDQHPTDPEDHDNGFKQWTGLWAKLMKDGPSGLASRLWHDAIEVADRWEQAHQTDNPKPRIHKGTPYYFWGVTSILSGDYETGFLLMHQAFKEDQKAYPSQHVLSTKPAYLFVTMDDTIREQFFREQVEKVAKFVEGQLTSYKERSLSNRPLTLDLAGLRSRFLKNPNLTGQLSPTDPVLMFVFIEFGLYKLLVETREELTKNTFGSLIEARYLFNLALIVDEVLKKKTGKDYLPEHVNGISIRDGWSMNGMEFGHVLQEANRTLQDDLGSSLSRLTSSNTLQYEIKDPTGKPTKSVGAVVLRPIQADFAVTYALRNFGGHKIEDEVVIYELFPQLTQRILNCLFYSIETYYP
jgi:hypothetical protein